MEDLKHDFAMEKRLKDLDSDLHRRFTDAVFALQFNLSNYKLIFPDFTDHTMLHSLTVIDFCNQLIGDRIEELSKDGCVPFNPKEWYEMTGDSDPTSNMGIRLVYGLAHDVNYQNLLGLNVLTIKLSV